MVPVLGVIPARYGSTRFPGKVLARLGGKILVQRVWEAAKACKKLDRLVVAVDDERILAAVRGFGGEAVMTARNHPCGTDRVWEAAKETQAQIIVNIQADEPMLRPPMVDQVIKALEETPQAQMATLRYGIHGTLGYDNPNVVKVVTDQNGWALYFSRAPIPAHRPADAAPAVWYKHIGLYAYRRALLERFVSWPPSPLEQIEKLEQLRALEQGIRIKVLDSPVDTVGVDTLEDLKRVEKLIHA